MPTVLDISIESLIAHIEGNKYWFVREGPAESIALWFGPVEYPIATNMAQYISQDEDRRGSAEVFSFVGTRPGDYASTPIKLEVNVIYVEGKQTAKGRAAAVNSGKMFTR